MGRPRLCHTLILGTFLLVMSARHVESQNNHVIMDGDVTLAAMLTIQDLEQGECGSYDLASLQSIVGITWFLQALNEMDYIPGTTLGLDVYRTCKMEDKATDGTVDLMTRYGVRGNSSCQMTNRSSVLFGLLGPGRTSEALAVTSLVSSLPSGQQLLQVSGTATGKQLADSARFPNFFRVIPPDDTQVRVILELLLQLQWNYVAIVYSDDHYGSSAATELRQLAEGRQVCIPVFESLPVDTRTEAFATKATEIANQLKSSDNGIVRGMVVLGGRPGTRSLLQTLSQHVTYVTLVLSESVALQRATLLSPTGQVSDLAPGAMVTSPPYLPLPKLTALWNDLWTNQSLFDSHVSSGSSSNPWLADYFRKGAGCGHRDAGCWEGSGNFRSSQLAVEGRELSLFVGYWVKATAVMAALLKQVLIDSPACGGVIPCPVDELREALSDRQLILDTLRGGSLDLSVFSPLSPAFFSPMTSLAFNSSTGGILSRESEEEYTVFNFRKPEGGGGAEFNFKKIGSWTESSLAVNTSEAEFYDESQQPLTWRQLPPAQCSDNHDCLKCQRDISQDIIFVEGDFYVVGFVPVSDRGEDVLKCGDIKEIVGADIAQSMVFTVDQINKKTGAFANVLPGRRVGLIVINSCGNKMLLKKRLIDIYSGALQLPDGRNSSALSRSIMGYVGAYFSANTIAMAETLLELKRPFVQVSGASMTPILSDTSRFPYFLRIPSSDQKQTEALMDIVVSLGVNYIQVMYDGSTTYASGVFYEIEAAIQNVNRYNVCIAQTIVTAPKTDISEYIWIKDKLRETPAARLVIVVLHHLEIQKVMDAILPRLNQDEFLFLATASWGRREFMIAAKSRFKLSGSLVLSQELVINQLFEEYFRKLQPDQSSNPWLAAFWEKKLNCYFDKSFTRKGKQGKCPENFAKDYMQDVRLPLHIGAVDALVKGFSVALGKVCGASASIICQQLTSDHLYAEMLKVKLDLYGTGQQIEVFDNKGDGLVGNKILQIEPDSSTPEDDDVMYTEVGTWVMDKLVLDKTKLTLASQPSFSSRCSGSECGDRCFQPHQTTCPSNSDLDSCCPACTGRQSDSKKDDSYELYAVVGVMAVLLVIVVVLIIVIVVLKRRQETKACAAAKVDNNNHHHHHQFTALGYRPRTADRALPNPDPDYSTIYHTAAAAADPAPRACHPSDDLYLHPVADADALRPTPDDNAEPVAGEIVI